jgi:deoxyribose-phosphate aldolase
MKITVERATEVLEKLDSTLLSPTATAADIEKLCNDALAGGFKAVVVNPVNVAACHKILKESLVKVCTVVGFPLGEDLTKVKVFETKRALKAKADEIDMVMCISAAKAGRWEYVGKEIGKIAKLCRKRVLKVIIETCFLTDAEIKQACEVVVRNGARFVKTSTGFGSAGAVLANVEIMHDTVSDILKTFKQDDARCEVKASGGIKTFEQAKAFVEAGATRIGTSSAMEILAESKGFERPVKKEKAHAPVHESEPEIVISDKAEEAQSADQDTANEVFAELAK